MPDRVLLLEDDDADARLTLRALRRAGLDVEHRVVDSAAALRAALDDGPWDVVLCDYVMPQLTALDALGIVRELDEDLPFIVISGGISEETAVAAMRAGAHDYLMKENLSRLGEAVRRELAEADHRRRLRRAERERKAAHERLAHLNRVLRAVRNINQLIVREHDPRTLIEKACAMLTEERGYAAAWIAVGDGAGPTAMLARAGCGEAFEALAASLRRGRWPGCLEDCLRSDDGFTTRAPGAACAECPMAAAHPQAPAAAALLRRDDRLLGMICVSPPPGMPVDDDERSLLLEIAGDVAFALHDIELEARRRQAEAERHAALMERVEHGRLIAESNRLLLELASLPPDQDVRRIIADSLRRITGAAAAWFSDYDPQARVLRVRGIGMEGGLLGRAVRLLGRRVEEIASPVSDETYRLITSTVVGRRRTLTEVSFGEVPAAVGAVVQKLIGAERFIGLAHMIDGRLFGTSVLAMKRDQPDPPEEWLEAIAHMIAVTLRRRVAEEALAQSEARHRAAQEVARIGHWELDALEAAPRWSDEIFRIFGLEPGAAEPSFTEHDTIIHPDDWPALQRAMREGFERGAPFDLTFRISRGRGEIGWMHAIGKVETDARGRTVRMFGTAQDITELRTAQAALAERERLLTTITDNMFDMVSLADLQGRCTYASPSHRQLGHEPEELVGRPVHELVHEDDRARILGELAAAAQADGARKVEHRYRRADGSYCWLESIGQLLAEDGRPSGLIFSSRDVSERRRAEQELAASEERFRALFENSLAPIGIADDEGRYLDVNPALCDLLGYAREQLLAMRVLDLVSGSESSAGEQYEAYRAAGGGRGEFAFVRPDGEPRVAVWAAAEISEGEHASVLQDITELKRYEQSLRAEKERAQRYLDVAAVILLGLDREGRITLLNRRGCEVLGFESQERALGEDWFQRIPGEERDRVRGVFDAIIDGEIVAHERVEAPVLTSSREKRRVVWHNAAVTDDRGEIVGTLSSGEDVTERREMEAQLAQADRLSSMGMLAAGVAHEINNPLSYVLYNLESLTEDLPGLLRAVREVQARLSACPEAGRIIGEVARRINPAMLDDIVDRFRDARDGAHRIRDIARGLGTFSRVEQSELVPVDLTHVIEVAVNMSYNEIKYRARLVKDYGRIPTIMASEGRLSQVFLNLIINATHAIDEGNVEENQIRVRTWAEGDSVFAEVRDTGCGIPGENLGRLFEPFFTTKKIGVGSGLGLAISRSIVESYGGAIDVQSEVGEGTRFTIRLPVRAEGQEEPAADAAPAAAEPAVSGRVLIVDDEAGIREAMARMLGEHETVLAASGAEARAILERDQAFDLILCDVMMPDVSGMDLHQWLVDVCPALARQLIFVTGGAFTPRAREYLGRVDNIRLEKPFDVANLKRMVSELVRAARAANGA